MIRLPPTAIQLTRDDIEDFDTSQSRRPQSFRLTHSHRPIVQLRPGPNRPIHASTARSESHDLRSWIDRRRIIGSNRMSGRSSIGYSPPAKPLREPEKRAPLQIQDYETDFHPTNLNAISGPSKYLSRRSSGIGQPTLRNDFRSLSLHEEDSSQAVAYSADTTRRLSYRLPVEQMISTDRIRSINLGADLRIDTTQQRRGYHDDYELNRSESRNRNQAEEPSPDRHSRCDSEVSIGNDEHYVPPAQEWTRHSIDGQGSESTASQPTSMDIPGSRPFSDPSLTVQSDREMSSHGSNRDFIQQHVFVDPSPNQPHYSQYRHYDPSSLYCFWRRNDDVAAGTVSEHRNAHEWARHASTATFDRSQEHPPRRFPSTDAVRDSSSGSPSSPSTGETIAVSLSPVRLLPPELRVGSADQISQFEHEQAYDQESNGLASHSNNNDGRGEEDISDPAITAALGALNSRSSPLEELELSLLRLNTGTTYDEQDSTEFMQYEAHAEMEEEARATDLPNSMSATSFSWLTEGL